MGFDSHSLGNPGEASECTGSSAGPVGLGLKEEGGDRQVEQAQSSYQMEISKVKCMGCTSGLQLQC